MNDSVNLEPEKCVEKDTESTRSVIESILAQLIDID